MDIFQKVREAEEAKGKARDAYKKAAEAVKATPEYKALKEANMKCWRASEVYKETARRN